MPKYQIDVPGQGTFEVDSPSDLTDSQAYNAVLGQIKNTPPADTGFTGALKAGKENLMADIERLKGKTGFKDVQEAEAAAQEREAKAKQVFKPTEESWTEAPLQKFKETLGGSLPYMAAPLAAGIGAAALPLTGAAATAAGIGAVGLTSAGQFTGSNLSRQVAEGKSLDEASLLQAGAAAIPQAALDVIGLRMIPGIRGILGKAGVEITEEQAAKLAQRSLLEKAGSVALTTGKTMGAEGLTETGQQVLERLQAGLQINDPQARKEYFDSFIGGAVLGGTLGTAGQAFESKRVIPNAPAAIPPAPTAEPTGQLGLGLEGGVETAGPRIPTVAQEAAPDNIAQIRDQYDTLEREMDRLKEAHATTDDLQEKKAILEQAQKLDYARQELVGQLEGAASRATAPEGQAALDFEQPYPKTRLQEAPQIIGQQPATPQVAPNLELEFAKQRLAAGAPITPAQELLVREAQGQERAALANAPAPEFEIPTIVGANARPTSYVVDDAAIDTFGVTKGATKFKDAIRGLDLMNPDDAAKFDKLVEQHERKNAKINMDAVEAFRAEKPEPVAKREVPEQAGIPARPYDARKAYQQAREAQFAFGQVAAPLSPRDVRAQAEAQYARDNGIEPVSGPDERGVPVPSVGLPTTEGVAAPEVTGVGSPIRATQQPNGRAAPSGENGLAALKQMAQTVAPSEAPAIKQEEEVQRVSFEEPLEDRLAKEEVSADTEELMRQLGIAKVQRGMLEGGTTEKLKERVFVGDLKGALKEIISDRTGQFTILDKEVAGRLLRSNTLPKIEVVDPSTIKDGAPALYNPNTDTVQIAEGQVDSHTVLHETVHGFLHVMIHDSNVRKVKGLAPNPLLKGLQDVYDHVKDNPALVEQYGLKDLSEFASEAMSNAEFQLALSKIPYKRMNVFTAFARAVLKALGIKVEGNVAQTDALAAVLIAAEQAMPQGRNIQEAVGAKANVGPAKLERLTKLEAAPTVGQKIKDSVKAVYDADKGDAWTKFRVAVVDPASGLAKRLSALPLFSNGQLRADMLHHQYAQVNNIVNNGIQSGVPVLNADGSVIIQDTDNNLARSNEIATSLNNNHFVKAQGMSGMEITAEVARILRGQEIMAEDAQRRSVAVQAMQSAENKLKEAKKKSTPGPTAVKLTREARALQTRYRDDVSVNREKQVTPEHIQWAQEQLKNVPEIKQVLDIWKNVNESLIQLREDGGLISKELADTLRQNNSYVPLFAAEEDLEAMRDPSISISGTGAKAVSQLHKLKGSELTRNIWENLYKQYAITTAAVFQNQVRKVGIEQLASLDAAEITQNAKDPRINVRFRDANSPYADSNGIVNAIVDNPNELAAFQMMHYQLTPLMKGMAGATRMLRAGALINPMYWVKQLIRDPLHASIVGGYVVTPADSIKEYVNILKGNSEEAKILARHGAFGAVDSTVDLQTFLKGIGTEKTTPTRMDEMLHKVMRMHEASDAATRVAIYKKAFADATSKGMGREEATTYAVMKARESANFSVHGNSQTLNSIRQMIPFFSAAVTSLDTVYRAATGYGLNPEEKAKAQKMFYSRAAMLTIMSMAYAMLLQGDEDYQKLPDDVKDGNWLMPNPMGGGHSFIRIPVPFEVGFLFKTVPEAAVRYLAGNSTGKEVLASYGAGVVQNLPGNGLIIPQAAKPILETMTNHSFFTGRSIESMSDQNLPVSKRGQNASEVAKILSGFGLDKINLSPAKIDNIIQGYTAQLGTFAVNAADAAIVVGSGKSEMAKNIEQLPGFKTFMTNPNTSKAVGDFYKLQHEAVETVAYFNKLKKSGDREEIMSYLADERNKKLIMAEPALRKIQTQLTNISNQAKLIKNNEKLDPEVRLQRVNALMTTYDKVAQQMNQVLRAANLER